MTTDSKQALRATGAATLLGAAGWCLGAAVVLGLVALLADGLPAAYAGLFGAVLVLVLFIWGAFVVDVVATVLPSATVLAALVTYGAQIATTAVALILVDRRELFLDERPWLAAGVVVGVLAWVSAQIVLTVRRRIPIYDLPEVPVPERSGAVER